MDTEVRSPWQNSLGQGPVAGGALLLPSLTPGLGSLGVNDRSGAHEEEAPEEGKEILRNPLLAWVGERAGHLENLLRFLPSIWCVHVWACLCTPFLPVGLPFVFFPFLHC